MDFIYTISIMLPVEEEVLNPIWVHTMVQKKKKTQKPNKQTNPPQNRTPPHINLSLQIGLYISLRILSYRKFWFYFPQNYHTATCWWLHTPCYKIRLISASMTIKMIGYLTLIATAISCKRIQDTQKCTNCLAEREDT